MQSAAKEPSRLQLSLSIPTAPVFRPEILQTSD